MYDDYHKFVKNLFKTKDFSWNVTHAVMGIAGEAGEVIDLWKKTYANGRELDQDKMIKELGDLLFYITALCNQFNIRLDEVMYENITKLSLRYPEGYSDKAAQERKDVV